MYVHLDTRLPKDVHIIEFKSLKHSVTVEVVCAILARDTAASFRPRRRASVHPGVDRRVVVS